MERYYRFAGFQLAGQRFELRKEGKPVAIQPKPLRLLIYLVAHRGRVVSKAELLEVLWPNETVCGGSLKRAVRAARRALGDDGQTQTRIRTVRGYGYEFVQQPIAQAGDPTPPRQDARSCLLARLSSSSRALADPTPAARSA